MLVPCLSDDLCFGAPENFPVKDRRVDAVRHAYVRYINDAVGVVQYHGIGGR
jgi:hypothetical protein